MYTETVMFFGVGMKGSPALRGRDYKWDIFQDRLRLVIALKAHEGGFFFFTWNVAGGGIAGKHLDYAHTQEWFLFGSIKRKIPLRRHLGGGHMVLNLWQQVSATSVAIDWLQRADASQNVQFRNKQNHTVAHTHHNKLHIGNVYYPPCPKSPARQPHTQTYTHIQDFSSFRRTPKEKFQILKEGAVAWEAAENTPATSHPVFQRLNNTSRTPLYADGGARRWKTIRAEDTFNCENKSKGGPVFKMSASVIDFFPQQVLSADLDSGWRIWGRRTKRRRQPCVAKQSRRGRRSLAPAYQAPRPTVWTRGFCCHRADGRARATHGDFLSLGHFGR